MTNMRVVISGYYGFNNSGDEAVLRSIIDALREASGGRIEPVVLSADPAGTEAEHGVPAVSRTDIRAIREAIRTSEGLISGGGSLLQDTTGVTTIPYYLGIIKLAQWMGKPTFVYAQGIGPIYRKWFYPLIKNVFQRTQYISVRDPESARLLEGMGISREKVAVVPDPVIRMESVDEIGAHTSAEGTDGGLGGSLQYHAPVSETGNTQSAKSSETSEDVPDNHLDKQLDSASYDKNSSDEQFSGPPVTGTPQSGTSQSGAPLSGALHPGTPMSDSLACKGSVAFALRSWGTGRDDVILQWADLADRLVDDGEDVWFLPFHVPADLEFSREIVLRMKRKARLFQDTVGPREMLGNVGQCRLLVGMRLHSLIYAANRGVPLVGVSYDPKIDQFLSLLQDRPACSTEQLDVDAVYRAVREKLVNLGEARAELRKFVDPLKERAMEPAKAIARILGVVSDGTR